MSKRKRGRSSARVRAEKRDTERSGNSYLKYPEGVVPFEVDGEGPYTIDFLCFVTKEGNPYKDAGEDHYERTFYIHKGIGPNNNWVICPKKTANKKCPVCEDVDRLRAETDKDDEEGQTVIKNMRPKERQLYVLQDKKSDDPDKIRVWDFSYHMFGKLLEAAVKDSEEEEEAEFFASAEGGSSLRVGFDEKTFNGAAYYEARSIKFKRRKDLPEDIADSMPCLDDMLVIPTYEQLRGLYMQEEPEEEEEEKPEKKPRSRGRKKEEKAPEPKDDDDGWGDDEDDSPPPKKEKPKKQKAEKEEPEPEPEPEKAEEPEKAANEDEWDDDW